MKIDKRYKLNKITETVDPSRFAIYGVHFNGRQAIATNGAVIAMVRCEPEEGDSNEVTVPHKFFANASPRNKASREFKLNGRAQTTDKELAPVFSDYVDANYPNYKMVLPNESRENYQTIVTLDANLLRALALGMGAEGKGDQTKVTLSLPVTVNKNGQAVIDSLSPVVVRSSNAPESFGVIMPMRK